jgi:hypothetical protein
MLSPTWVFGVPAIAAMGVSSFILMVGLLHLLGLGPRTIPFGVSWTIAAGFLFTTAHLSLLMGCATHLYGVRNNYRHLHPLLRRCEALLRLESMLIAGCSMIAASLAGFVGITVYWSSSSFAALPNILPLVLCAVVGATGAQTVFGGFLLAIIAGNNATFVSTERRKAA